MAAGILAAATFIVLRYRRRQPAGDAERPEAERPEAERPEAERPEAEFGTVRRSG